MRTLLPFVVLAVACSSGNHPGGGGLALGAPESGRATYYDATGEGACSFDATPDALDVAAIDAPEWNGSAPCGACVAVHGPRGDLTVRIVDLCPGCEAGHLDLSMEAFAKIADVAAGNVPITWQLVACDVAGNVQYRFKEGSSRYWTAIQVRNHRLPIAALELRVGGGDWKSITRSAYDYFVDEAGIGSDGPFDVRITAVDGQQLTDTLPAVQSGVVVDGAAQFR